MLLFNCCLTVVAVQDADWRRDPEHRQRSPVGPESDRRPEPVPFSDRLLPAVRLHHRGPHRTRDAAAIREAERNQGRPGGGSEVAESFRSVCLTI